MQISESVLLQIIDLMPVARLSLVTPYGKPDAMPIVFARVKNKIFSPIDDKPKKSSRLSRLSSIRGNPDTLLLLDHYSKNWSDLWWIRLNCVARVVNEDNVYWGKAVNRLLEKYTQYQTVGLFKGDQPTMLEFEWKTVRSWAYLGEKGFTNWLETRRDSSVP